MPADRRILERFHHLAIRLLRAMRRVDERHGFTGPRASALSVLVLRGPCSLGELALAEGVAAPTMSRLVKSMQADGLVEIAALAGDRRRVRIAASAHGRSRLLAARAHRIEALERLLKGATPAESKALDTVSRLLERSLEERSGPR